MVDATLGFALETQTLSLYDKPWFDGTYGGRGVWEPTMVHELSHMWFGDSVAPYSWDDLWLNEGHATWYEWTWAAANGELEEDIGIADFEELMEVVYSLGDRYRAAYGPVGAAAQRRARAAVQRPGLLRRRARALRAAPAGR